MAETSKKAMIDKNDLASDLDGSKKTKLIPHKVEYDEETGKYILGFQADERLYGTDHSDIISRIIDQLSRVVCARKELKPPVVVERVNAAIASVIEIQPKDTLELMLATQMSAVHYLALEMSERAMLSDQTENGVDLNINRINKLMRTFTSQVEALSKYRNKGKQQITVKHQNVNVNDGGQAVIGDIKGGGNG